MHKMNAKYPGTCAVCGERVDAGNVILYDRAEKTVTHVECAEDAAANAKSPVKPVQAGTVARYNPPK